MTSVSAGRVVYTTGEDCPWAYLYRYFAEGAEASPASEGLKPGVGIIWGLLRGTLPLIGESIKRRQPWVYIDHGYFDRGHFDGHYRATWCDFQQRGVIDRPADRWEQLGINLAPWKRGRNVVVCPPSDLVLKIMGQQGWTERTLEALKEKTDRPVVIQTKGMDFDVALGGAHCVVTISSIAAVEAVSKGVPAFVSPLSAAAPVARTDLEVESPAYPDREAWARSLAYGQFTKEEWASGLAWDVLSADRGL